MANHYTHFSFEFPVNTEAEYLWIKENLDIFASDPDSNGFGTDFPDHDPPKAYPFNLWINDNAGESEVECVIDFIESFFRAVRPTGTFGFEWANTCSRPLLDSFGGGAAFIDGPSDTTKWTSTSTWLSDQRQLAEIRATERATKAAKPLASTVEVAVWDERDRLHIHAFVGDENHTVAEWWDDAARAMFVDGFFTAGPKLVKSVRAYLVEVGLARNE